MNKMALRIHVNEDDWTAKRAIIASSGYKLLHTISNSIEVQEGPENPSSCS